MNTAGALKFNDRRRARLKGDSVIFATVGQAEPVCATRYQLRAVWLTGLVEFRHLHHWVSNAFYEIVL